MAALPMHPCSLEAGLDDVFVGALHHAGANRPALVSKGGILHQGLSLAQIVQMLLDALALGQLAFKTVSHAQQETGTSMFEDVQTPLEHLIRNREAYFLQGFEQLAHMFCGMWKIQDAQRVGPMPLGKGLAPVCAIRDRTDLFCLPDLAPVELHICQFGKGGGIGEPRKIRELANVDLWLSSGAALLVWLTNGDGAYLDPLFLDQRHHGSITADDRALWHRLCS